jgi:hypothetical protein
MDARRLLADEQLLGDLAVASSGGQASQDFDLPGGQSQVAGCRGWTRIGPCLVERDPSPESKLLCAPTEGFGPEVRSDLPRSGKALRDPRAESRASASRHRQYAV